MKLRYTGSQATTFLPAHRTVQPGDEFDMPASQARRFLQHGRIEPVDDEARKLAEQMQADATERAEQRARRRQGLPEEPAKPTRKPKTTGPAGE